MARGSGKTGFKIVGPVIAAASLVLCVEQYLSYGQEQKRIQRSLLTNTMNLRRIQKIADRPDRFRERAREGDR
jgi:hypothetical protein